MISFLPSLIVMAVGARAEVPELAEAAERDERGGVVDFGEAGLDRLGL